MANRLVIGALVVSTIPLAAWEVVRHRDAAARRAELARTVPQEGRAGFATSNRCESCHPSQYHSWHRGYHRTMTQYASPASVRGDFDDVQLDAGGYRVRLFRRGEDFMAEMVDPLWQYEVDAGQRVAREAPPIVERRIALVTGSHHMQAYWVPSLVGNGVLSLPFTYLFEDRRWVPRGEVFLHPPDDRRHPMQVWNVSCIRCHSTAGKPNALVGGKEVKSRVAEIGIACEACHGPGERHIAANSNPITRYAKHVKGGGDPTIVNPARLPAARASEVCGQCHSLTDVSQDIELGDGKRFTPGDELEQTMPLLRPLHPTPALDRKMILDSNYQRGYFWGDGIVRVSSRDHSGMIESKCMTGGALSCGSCHSLHESDPDDLLAKNMETDAACTGCHPAIGAALEGHTHHRAGSTGSRCYNCHMPHTVYGLLKSIRNHRIDSPVVAPSTGDGRPNACNLCHVDRSLAWSAQAMARWYKRPVPADLGDEPSEAVAWLLSGDAVLRAIAAWHLGWDGARSAAKVDELVPYLVAALDDPYAAVRYVAARSLRRLVPGSTFDYLADADVRKRSAAEILARWRGQRSPAELRAIDARIQTLVEQRDNTPVWAME